MDQTDTVYADWKNLDGGGAKAEVDCSSDAPQKQESSSILDNHSEPMYDSSNLGGDDDYMSSLGLYDGYDSYNDSGGTTEEDERYDTSFTPPSFYQTSKAAALQKKNFRFLNGKDGMATCEQCGSVGVRHAFYSKSKRFCSLSCSRSFATAQREGRSQDNPPPAKKGKPSAGGRKSKSQSQQKGGVKQDTKEFDWGTYLTTNMVSAAPVPCFPHVPMSDSWDQIEVGMKVEVANMDCDLHYPVFWIASVIKVAGFTALMRYEGFGNDSSRDFWASLVSPDVHPVGWCATIGKPLVPPQSIQSKYSDWKEFLVKRLTGSRTLPGDFHQLFQDGMNNHKFRPGMKVEVVNKVGVSSMKVAVICQVVGGRLRLNYVDSKDEGDEFWCHMRSPLIHHVGWSLSVGHNLEASKEYRSSCLSKVTTQKFSEQDVSPDMMPKMKDPPHSLTFSVGMKLEAIDPLNLSAICVATVMKVLRHNYLMIGIDGSPMVETGSDWFCYHTTSPCIFPVGFCEINNIDLTPPKGHKGTFKWFDYLKQTKSHAAPVKLFDKDIPKHGFQPGMKIEAVDLMEPRLICVATVTRIVGRLLRIHFDGWENEYDQWVDCQSPDIYPVGWCQAMKYTLEGPRIKENGGGPITLVQKKKKARNQIYKGPRKKRKSKPGQGGNTIPAGYRFLSSSHGDSQDKYWMAPASKGGMVRPPHVPLPPEAVAANLPPLKDPDVPEASKRTPVEGSKECPMDVSTPVTPTSSSQPVTSDSLPTLSPKGEYLWSGSAVTEC
ncbi:MBT domain-containing protein 1-like isoform X2 [Babylonia areolata]|uniref:MBT domain-containing protein 1-like isoform X2 n=1 Tax=Babylonia areolata TaxID=304850 RepID=UPI003FD19A20